MSEPTVEDEDGHDIVIIDDDNSTEQAPRRSVVFKHFKILI